MYIPNDQGISRGPLFLSVPTRTSSSSVSFIFDIIHLYNSTPMLTLYICHRVFSSPFVSTTAAVPIASFALESRCMKDLLKSLKKHSKKTQSKSLVSTSSQLVNIFSLQAISVLALAVVAVTILPLAVPIAVFTTLPEIEYKCQEVCHPGLLART